MGKKRKNRQKREAKKRRLAEQRRRQSVAQAELPPKASQTPSMGDVADAVDMLSSAYDKIDDDLISDLYDEDTASSQILTESFKQGYSADELTDLMGELSPEALIEKLRNDELKGKLLAELSSPGGQEVRPDSPWPRSEAEYVAMMRKRKMLRASGQLNNPLSLTKFEDPLLQSRWDALRADHLDAVDLYFDFFRVNKLNCHVTSNQDTNAGEPDDYRRIFTWDGRADAMDYGKDAFVGTLKDAEVFAFPFWWYQAACDRYHIELMAEFSYDFEHPFPLVGFTSLEKWAETPQPSEEEMVRHKRRLWNHNIENGFPEHLPFNQTFIGFEDAGRVGGRLIYQRVDNQRGMVTEHGCPTAAYSPDGILVPLDCIYLRGFLLDGSRRWAFGKEPDWDADEHLAKGSQMIWGLFHGYVISKEHCPNDMPFLRIPMVVPLYIEQMTWSDADENVTQHPSSAEMRWVYPLTTLASPIRVVLQAIDDHRVVQERKFNTRQKRKKRQLKAEDQIEVRHRRYQRVQMRRGPPDMPKRKRQGNEESIVSWTLKHRVKVRSHERVYIRRGQKPLKVEDRKEMVERGYRVYLSEHELTFEDARRLHSRKKLGPQHSHWVAIKDTRVKEHKRGPEDAEIIPLVRVVDNEVLDDTLDYQMTDEVPRK